MLGVCSLGMLTSCGIDDDSSSSSSSSSSSFSSSSSSQIEKKADSIYVGLYAKSAYSPEIDGDFDVGSSDESMLNYKDGYVLTYGKEGDGTITFSSSFAVLTLSVRIEKDSTLPSFSLLHDDISVYKNATYELPFTLSYGGNEVTSYLEKVNIVKESGEDVAQIVQNGSALSIQGKTIGSATYTVSAEFLGYYVSKQLVVNVKEDTSFFVYGERMSYDEEGPKYSIKMYGYSTNPLVLSDDLKASYNGQTIQYSSLKVEMDSNEFASIDDKGKVSFVSTGSTSLTVSYEGKSAKIRLIAYKEITNNYVLDLLDRDFSLEKEVTIDKSAGTRTFSDPSTDVYKSISIPESYGNFAGVDSLSVDDEEITAKDASYLNYDVSDKTLRINSKLFDASYYGVKTVTVVLEADEYLAKFSFELLFITKTITTFADFGKYIAQASAADTIYGYYVLGNDIDANGAYSAGSWTTSGWDYSRGFRGTLDGRNFAIKNMKAGEYGISGLIGSGALIQNIDFENVTYLSQGSSGQKYALFSRGMKGATFRHINISLSEESSTNVGEAGTGKSIGLFTVENAEACQFEHVKVDATGFDVLTLVGKQASNTVYSDCELICKSLQFVYGGTTIESVSGIKLTIA